MHSLEHQYVLRAYGTSEGLNSSDKERPVRHVSSLDTSHSAQTPKLQDSAPLVVLSPSWREYVESGTDRLLEFPICTFHA
jgi:hypothetical protein